MPPPETLPAIETCVDLYVEICDSYGTDVFDPESLSQRLGSREGGTDLPADVRSLIRLLDLLAAYGLLLRHPDGRYRVQCAPDEDLDRWRVNAVDRIESLYRRVQRATGSSPDGSTDDSDPEQLRRAGVTFASLRVTDPTDLDSARTTVRTVLDERPECAGIVLRSPGELAAEVQRFADELCESQSTATGGRAFEKEATELVGDHKDDLEFRLFLRETT